MVKLYKEYMRVLAFMLGTCNNVNFHWGTNKKNAFKLADPQTFTNAYGVQYKLNEKVNERTGKTRLFFISIIPPRLQL